MKKSFIGVGVMGLLFCANIAQAGTSSGITTPLQPPNPNPPPPEIPSCSEPPTYSCQSSTLCVHPSMPVWRQGDPLLLSYINSVTGDHIPADPGWCGGVSSAEVIDTVLSETVSNPENYPTPYSGLTSEYAFIYQTFLNVGTNITSGWTTDSGVESYFVSLAGRCRNTSWGTQLPSVGTYIVNLPIGHLTIQGEPTTEAHMVSIDGVEGGYYKIFDPWGSIYNVVVDGSMIYFANGSTDGYVPANGGSATVESSRGIYSKPSP